MQLKGSFLEVGPGIDPLEWVELYLFVDSSCPLDASRNEDITRASYP